MQSFLEEHHELTRRFFLKAGVVGWASVPVLAATLASEPVAPVKHVKPDKAGVRPEPYFTPSQDFRDVSRGKPLPHSLSDEEKRAVGMTRETWQLEVLADPDHPAKLGKPLTKKDGTALEPVIDLFRGCC